MDLIQLSKRIDKLIELGLRSANPLYHADASGRHGTRRIGQGKEQSVRIRSIISPQADISAAKARSLKGKMDRGTYKASALPEGRRHGARVILHDGNHRVAAALKAGKRKIVMRVSK